MDQPLCWRGIHNLGTENPELVEQELTVAYPEIPFCFFQTGKAF